MINYTLQGCLTPLPDTGMLEETDNPPILIQVLTFEEYEQHFGKEPHFHSHFQGLQHIRHCKADVLGSYVSGAFCMPTKEKPTIEKISFGFYMTKNQLVFIENKPFAANLLTHLSEVPFHDASSVFHVLFTFMEHLIKDDSFFLQHFEENLSGLEEEILRHTSSDFNQKILKIRQQLAALGAYYEQLQDMAEDLQQGTFELGSKKDGALLGIFINRVGRLLSNVQMLKEYSMQLREMHQTQVDIHQNQIMKFLTIVTTIFMPLTLIAGWYGMNFSRMPELVSPYGYIVICLISLVIVLLELWLFKVKKWFD